MWSCGCLLVKRFILWWEVFMLTTNQEFIHCYNKLTSCWCFPRELSGIHKNRINLCFGSHFHLECRACLLKKFTTGHVGVFLLSYSQISQLGCQLDSLSPILNVLYRELVLFIVHQFSVCQHTIGSAVERMAVVTFH